LFISAWKWGIAMAVTWCEAETDVDWKLAHKAFANDLSLMPVSIAFGKRLYGIWTAGKRMTSGNPNERR
jgi:hypothetical protein